MKFTDYEHLLRLAALFGAGVLVFVAAQAVLVPADFGKYGHYRAGALDTARAKPIVHAGEAACSTCHEEASVAKAAGRHAGVRCESCHGPQAAHAEGGPPPARPDTALCRRCHETAPARPSAFPQVNAVEHAGGERCTTCHVAHAPSVS